MAVTVPVEIGIVYSIAFMAFAAGMAMVIRWIFRQDVLCIRPIGCVFQGWWVGVTVGAVVFVDGKRLVGRMANRNTARLI